MPTMALDGCSGSSWRLCRFAPHGIGTIRRDLAFLNGWRRGKERVMPENQRKKRWSAEVTAHSDALDLEPNVFEKDNAGEIARSLKRSAEASDRRKSSPYRSAMSMLTFYINRAGRNLPAERKQTLEAAKGKLRELFGRNR
jgi:hypothetical protein